MNLLPNIILSNFFLILIYLVYKGGFSRIRFFQANRIFLLTGTICAVALPWISPAMNLLGQSTDIQWLPTMPVVRQESANQAGNMMVEPISRISLFQLILWIYLSVIAGIIIISAFQWIRLKVSWRKAPVHRYGKLKIIVIKHGWSAFSYFRTVYYPEPFDPGLPETRVILGHELVHARQLHSLDNIFFGIIRLVFFYNPWIYLLHKELKITHEYLADRVTSVGDRLRYSSILISHQFKVPHFVLMQPFNKQSFLKRRLIMLSKNTQTRHAGWKYLLLAPLLGGMILLSGWSASAQGQAKKSKEEIAKMAVEKELTKAGFTKADIDEIKMRIDGIAKVSLDPPEPATDGNKEFEEEEDSKTFLVVEEMPEFKGGNLYTFRDWVQSNVKYPQIAMENSITGTVYVSFVVDRKGQVGNINIVRSVDPSLDEAVVNVLKSAPDWKPGMQKGKAVRVSFSIPVKFVKQ